MTRYALTAGIVENVSLVVSCPRLWYHFVSWCLAPCLGVFVLFGGRAVLPVSGAVSDPASASCSGPTPGGRPRNSQGLTP